MRIRTLFLLPLLVMLIGQINAQDGMSKEEAKKWKSIAKDYKKNPEALKDIIEERNEYQAEVEKLRSELASVESNEPMLQNRIAQLEQENMQLSTNLMSTQESVRQLQDENALLSDRSGSSDNMMMGTVYRVQIGAYAKRRVEGALATGDDMSLEESDGMQKILIGQFRDYGQANELMNYFKTIGLKDAWVVPYIDGRRVSLKEALGTQN